MGSHPSTIRGIRGQSRTRQVRALRPGRLMLALLWFWSSVALAQRPLAGGTVDAAELERSQAAGWLELRGAQARYRERIRSNDQAPGPGSWMGPLDIQEGLDRSALDRQQSRWVKDARRTDRYAGPGSPSKVPAARLRIQRSESGQRLGRDLRRYTLGAPPPVGPNPAPAAPAPQFRLR